MNFRPVLDRILLRKIEKKQTGSVVIPDQYQESNEYEVVAIGDFVVIGGQRIPLVEIVSEGDVVLVGQYSIEACEIEGEKLWLSRVQDIRGREARKQSRVPELDRVVRARA